MAIEKTINIDVNEKDAEKGFGALADAINKLNSTFQDFQKDTEDGLDGIKDSAEKSSKGISKIGKTLKVIGSGAGVFLVLNKAFELFKEIGEKNQRVLDIFNTSFEVLSIAFNDFFNFVFDNAGGVVDFFKGIFENPVESIKGFGQAIKENIIERIKSSLEVLGFLASAVKKVFTGDFKGALEDVKSAGAEFVDTITGVDNSVEKAKEIISETTDAIVKYGKETIKSAKDNIELGKAAELAAVKNQGLIEKYDRQAELQRQIRDDESKSIAERIKANNELARILDLQEEKMLANAAIQVAAAKAELDKNKESIELQKAYQEALNEQAGVEAQIAGFRSEQLTNINSLEREQIDIKNELALIGKSQREIELIELQQQYDTKKALIEKEVTDEEDKARLISALNIQYAQQTAEAEVGWATYTQEEKLGLLKKGMSELTAGFGEQSAVGKAAAVANATISTYESAVSSYNSLAGIPYVGPILGAAAAAAAINSGKQTISKILSTKTPGNKGVSGGPSISGGVPQTESQAPSFNVIGATGTSQLAESIAGQTQEPVKAYVVSNDVTSAQSLDRNIVEEASI